MHVYVDLFHVYQQQWSSIIIGKRLECLREYVNPWASPRDHLYAATICKSKDEVVGLYFNSLFTVHLPEYQVQ